jgi:hypothetical protein
MENALLWSIYPAIARRIDSLFKLIILAHSMINTSKRVFSMPVATTDAFRRITVQPDNVTIAANATADTLTLVAGQGISLVANTSIDQITIVNTGSNGSITSVEPFSSPAISGNAVTCNFSTSAVFALGSNNANITAHFINISTIAGLTISTSLIISQGGIAYIPSVITINTVSQTIKWQGNTTPSGNINKTDIVSFTFICTATGTYTVIGSLNTYG